MNTHRLWARQRCLQRRDLVLHTPACATCSTACLPANVSVSYAYTGLGFAGRPGGPVPTITVELQNLNFQFFFLGGLMGFGNIAIFPI